MGLVYLVVELIAVGFVCWLLTWAIDQFVGTAPTPPTPFAVGLRIIKILIIVVGALLCLFLILRFIGVPF